VIDAGVFHNDVIAVGHRDVLFYHEAAFLDETATIDELRAKLDGGLKPVRVSAADVSVADAVESYLFNSQLLSKPNNPMGPLSIVVPDECRQNPRVWKYLDNMSRTSGIIDEILVFDLRESMRNGGGPACLRLRVELTEAEAHAVNQKVMLTDERYVALTAWVNKHYRDRMGETDLGDPTLLIEVRTALDELTQLLGLGSVYPFQLD
jgi:succinylarginine dihydrolase